MTFEEKSSCLNIYQGNQYNSTVKRENLSSLSKKEKNYLDKRKKDWIAVNYPVKLCSVMSLAAELQ